jgi:hypothetical protein
MQIAAYRVHAWVDTSKIADGLAELPLLYGIQARIAGKRRWHHMAENSKALLFQKPEEAEAWITEHPTGEIKGRFATPSPALRSGGDRE